MKHQQLMQALRSHSREGHFSECTQVAGGLDAVEGFLRDLTPQPVPPPSKGELDDE